MDSNRSGAERRTILVVDDESAVGEVVQEYLSLHGYACQVATDAAQARRLVAAHPIDLSLIDINMPGEDGLALARFLRERHAGMAIVMLTAADTVIDRIVGLEMGADDYVTKPFDPRELVARIRSVLRRTAAREEIGDGRIRVGRCVVDLGAHRLLDESGDEIAVTPLEFDLLKALTERPNRVLSRDQILLLGRQREGDPYDRSVDLRVMRLRRKIEPDPLHPRFIRTVRNAGYVFVPEGR